MEPIRAIKHKIKDPTTGKPLLRVYVVGKGWYQWNSCYKVYNSVANYEQMTNHDASKIDFTIQEGTRNSMTDLLRDPTPKLGLYQKFMVFRTQDTEHKHDHCSYFVLDLQHDPYAARALRAYAKAVAPDNLILAQEINLLCDELESSR